MSDTVSWSSFLRLVNRWANLDRLSMRMYLVTKSHHA